MCVIYVRVMSKNATVSVNVREKRGRCEGLVPVYAKNGWRGYLSGKKAQKILLAAGASSDAQGPASSREAR
jgi:hypothetical protein